MLRDGLILIDKPAGVTSRRVSEAVGRCFEKPRKKRRDGSRFRVGHAGTLDPLATGLLLVLVGRGTRLQPFLQGLDKRYTATVRLGMATDSLDADGEVTGTAPVPEDPGELEVLARRFTGVIEQVPPVVSALKRGGRSLHELVRRDPSTAPPAAREVKVHALAVQAGRWGELVEGQPVHELLLDVHCGAGTYIRSLARDLAEAMGTVGHVTALRRLQVGPFVVDDAVVSDGPCELVQAALRPLATSLPHLPALTVSQDRAGFLRQGGQPDPGWFVSPPPALFRLLDPAGVLTAIGRVVPEGGRPAVAAVFPVDLPEDDPCG